MFRFNSKRLDDVLAAMQSVHVAVVGDVMLDRYVWGEVERISPEAPVPIVSLSGESSNLGGAANVAANVAGLGAEATLFGVVGSDKEGEIVRELLGANGSSGDGIVVSPDRPTSVKTRIIAHNQHVVRIDRETTRDLDDRTAQSIIESLTTALNAIDVVILQDYNKGVLSLPVIDGVLKACRKRGIPVGVDPKRTNFWAYIGATLCKPNFKELSMAVGASLAGEGELESIGWEVKAKLKLEHLLITRGADGMALFSDGEMHHIPTQAHRVHDVSGAGDTVIATMMTAMSAGATPIEAALLANFAASVVIAEVGAIPVDAGKLRRACFA